jgi:hypothetical protein
LSQFSPDVIVMKVSIVAECFPMELTYDLTQRDFYDSFMAHRRRTPALMWSFRLLFGLTFIFPVIGVAVLATDRQAEVVTVAPLFALAAFWAIFIWVIPWWSARSQFWQQPAAQGSKTMTLDGSGIHWRWRNGQAHIEWTNFIRFLESKTVFLLYTSPACFNIVPKRAFAPDQTDSFRSLLEEKLGAASRPRRKKLSPQVLVFLAVIVSALVLLAMAIRNIR